MRKGQNSASSIMVLLILLALFIVLYVLLLPPADRDALLNNNSTNTSDNYDTETGGTNLLYEMPGTIAPQQSDDQIIHNMDYLDLFVKSEPVVTTLSNSIQIEKTSFGHQDQSLFFNLDNLGNLNSAFLVFSVTESKGNLIIELNGNQIYNKNIKQGQQEKVELPKAMLKDRNELKFSVSSPGVFFFMKNSYSLQDLTIKQDLEVINSKESRSFTVTAQEKDNLLNSRLDFSAYCHSLEQSATSLKIYLNNKLLSSEVISCGGGDRGVDLNIDDINQGQNDLMFVIDSGDFTISQIKVTNKLKQGIFKTYEFDLAIADYKEVLNQNKRVVLRMSFNDTGLTNSGRILLNEDQLSLSTTSKNYIKDISKSVTDGVNKLRIVPDKEITINTLKITLEDIN